MNSACGHKEAVCIIGNYWECKVCETAPKSAMTSITVNNLMTGDSNVARPTTIYLSDGYIANKRYTLTNEMFAVKKSKFFTSKWIISQDDILGYKLDSNNKMWAKIKSGAVMYRKKV